VMDQGCWSDVAKFGVSANAMGRNGWSVQGEPDNFEVLQHGQEVGRVQWDITGVHNQLNALAAIAAAAHLGVSPSQAAASLTEFQNVRRRMEVRGTVPRAGGDITVYDDFAHHPTAIRTTVDGLRRKVGPNARILAVFEPRSNTMKLGTMKSQLPWSLEDANLAFCYSGGLDWDAEEALSPMGARASVAGSVDEVIARVVGKAQAGDHVLCMSNGGFGGIHAKLLAALASAA
jgi:UDP-N-acetylmuramate: L-alanyl-gamma-D-glutamyl-meso-diaminopimelate ligase